MTLPIQSKRAIIKLHVRGFKNKFIGEYIKCNPKTVTRCLKKWKEGTLFIPAKRKVNSKLSAQEVYNILDYFINNPFSTYNECITKLKLPVSRMTIQRALTKNGVRNYVAVSKQFISMQNQIKRLQFAIKYQHWTDEWLQVYFLDEKTVQTYTDGRVFVKRRLNERWELDKIVVQEVQNAQNKVNLVGAISFTGRNVIYSVSTNFTGKQFEQLVKTKLIDTVRGSTLLMDNAAIHNLGINFLKSTGVRVLDFPPKSNDLNIIEIVWAELQKMLNRELRTISISTKSQLLQLIERCWKQIPINFIKKVVLSMPNRLKKVIEMKGRQTRY